MTFRELARLANFAALEILAKGTRGQANIAELSDYLARWLTVPESIVLAKALRSNAETVEEIGRLARIRGRTLRYLGGGDENLAFVRRLETAALERDAYEQKLRESQSPEPTG